MIILIYIIVSTTCSALLCLFSFWVGRCSRKLPTIDNNLPWTISRDQARRCNADCDVMRTPPPGPRRWPDKRVLRFIATGRPKEHAGRPRRPTSLRTLNSNH
jgi:hypothetical protein